MANTILITANWHTGALSQQTISRQYDNNRYAVQFIGYPEASEGNELDYYLLVWMSSAPGERPDEIAPIQLASDQWYISNVFTQQTQQIKFQMCALNTEGTFEAHSPIFTGFVRSSLEHDGATQDIDVSTLFDAYREYLNELIIQAGAVVIDSTPTQGSSNAVSSGGVFTALEDKADKGITPETATPTETDADFYLADENGNVLLELADGHIKTKNFDSANIDIPDAVDNYGITGDADLYITDAQGNVIAYFKDGGFATKRFDSSDPVVKERIDYAVTVSNYSGATDAILNQAFSAGDTLIFHVSIVGNNVADTIGNYLINYYGMDSHGGQTLLASDYGYNFPKVTLSDDYVAFKASLPNNLTWGKTKDIKFIVYKTFGADVKTREITVKKDGTGDFDNLRDAIDGVDDNNAITKYIIKVHPGTYNVLDDYTQAEILDPDFKGLIVKNGLYIEGVGQLDDIVINAYLDDSDTTYDSVRNNISAFNMAGDSGISNMVIHASKMRYCIHDDIGSLASRTHIFKNLVLRPSQMTSASAYNIAYGAGIGNKKTCIFDNVDFGDVASAHGSTGWEYSPHLIFNNCCARVYQFGEYDSAEKMYITMNNCKGVAIRMARDSTHAQMTRLEGIGTNDIIMDCYPGFIYNLGQCEKFENVTGFSAGQAVALGTAYNLSATTSKDRMYGIVLGELDGDTYIQIAGYIDANTFGITGLSVGDYVHLDSNGIIASGGSQSDAIGIVVSTSTFEGGAFIKLY